MSCTIEEEISELEADEADETCGATACTENGECARPLTDSELHQKQAATNGTAGLNAIMTEVRADTSQQDELSSTGQMG